MRLRRFLSILIATVLIFAAVPFTVRADEDTKSFTTVGGVTLSVPSDMEVLWYGMDDNDPTLDPSMGVDANFVKKMYEEGGIELQGNLHPAGKESGQFFFLIVNESKAPKPADEAAFLDLIQNTEYSLSPAEGEEELLGYGTVEANGITLFKYFCQGTDACYIRTNKYFLLTDSGMMHEIAIVLNYDFEGENAPAPFPDEDIEYLDYLAELIAASLTYEGGTVAPEAEPFRMVIGDTKAAASEDAVAADDSGSAAGTARESSSTVSNTTVKKNFFTSFTAFEFPIWLIAIAMVVILLAGAKVSKFKEWQEEPLSLETSKCIQGFAAVAIILHHLTQELEDKAGVLGFLSECGVLFVGVFFFFSGYGLYTSLKTKKDYLKGFLRKRFLTILIPFYMCIFVFTTAACISGLKLEGLEILAVLSGWSLINSHMWYIVEIAILYLVFFILYKLIKNRTVATVLMSVFVLGMMYFSLQLAHGEDYSCSYWFMGEWWYNSSFLFVIGIIVSKHAEFFRKIARKAYWALIPVFAVLVFIFGGRTHYMLENYSYWSEIPGEDPAIGDKLRCLSMQLPWIMCFVILLLLIMMKVKFGNPVLKFLGTISLELYLLHNLFLMGLHDGSLFKVTSASMYMLLTVLMAIGLATVVSGFDKYLIGLVTGRKSSDLALVADGSHNHLIDIMRGVMAFLVVTIHVPFEGKAGEVFITFGKTAVPFFLVVCGYFLFREDTSEMMKRLLKQTKRIFIFYVLSNLFYMGMVAITGEQGEFKACFTGKAIKDFLLYNFSPFSEHLWFLGSLLYALLIMLLLNKLKVLKHAAFIGPVLVAAYVVLSHIGVAEGYQLRNALLVGLGYTLTGMLIRRFEKKILAVPHIGLILLILFAICSATAIVELNHYKQGVAVPFVSCEILTIVIVLLCLRFPKLGVGTFAEKFGKNCSLPIYILHIAVLMLFSGTSCERFFGCFGAVTIFVVTACIAGAYASIKNAVIKTK